MKHVIFHYPTLKDVQLESDRINGFIPLKEDVSALFEPLPFPGGRRPTALRFSPWKEPMEQKTARRVN